MIRGHCRLKQCPLFCLFILVRTLIQPMYELNVNALCSVTFLTLCSHHLPEKEILRFFVIVPDFFLAVADGSDCACSRHCEFGYSKHKIASINYCCESIIADNYSRVQLYGMIVIILVKCAARIIILPVHIVLKSIPLEPASEKNRILHISRIRSSISLKSSA